MRYSLTSLLKQTLTGHEGWTPQWRDAAPKPVYDIVIVGGGGHGLATAYYLAKEYGLRNIAVLEKSWIGSGNIGRNTTIIRSNYLLSENISLYELSMKLWEGLEQDFNYNAMVSQRGVLNLYHSDGQRDAYARRGNVMRLNGVDAELLDREGVRRLYPFLNFDAARFPIQGGLLQKRGGTVRHDAVAWGYARGAERPRRRCDPELRSHRASISSMVARWAWRPRAARSGARRSASPLPARRRASPRWPGCGCRSRAMCCRPSSPKA